MLAADRNAGRMNLGEARVREERAFFVGSISRGHVATARVRRKIKNVSVAAGREHDRIAGVRLDFSRDEAAGDDSFRVAIDHDEIEHLRLRKHRHAAGCDLAGERLVSAKQ